MLWFLRRCFPRQQYSPVVLSEISFQRWSSTQNMARQGDFFNFYSYPPVLRFTPYTDHCRCCCPLASFGFQHLGGVSGQCTSGSRTLGTLAPWAIEYQLMSLKWTFPSHNLTTAKHSWSFLSLVPAGWRPHLQTIISTPTSSRIFYFLLLNLAYMGVQMVYGVFTNSLGLISDGKSGSSLD